MMITEVNNKSCFWKLYTSADVGKFLNGFHFYGFEIFFPLFKILLKTWSKFLLNPVTKYKIFVNGTVGNIFWKKKKKSIRWHEEFLVIGTNEQMNRDTLCLKRLTYFPFPCPNAYI